ncbi:hypothetical protein HWV62_11662 [Athelia sp. TMB]|nr:hypothetical protein HWV62_11662 [Athelia sp. TMB]
MKHNWEKSISDEDTEASEGRLVKAVAEALMADVRALREIADDSDDTAGIVASIVLEEMMQRPANEVKTKSTLTRTLPRQILMPVMGSYKLAAHILSNAFASSPTPETELKQAIADSSTGSFAEVRKDILTNEDDNGITVAVKLIRLPNAIENWRKTNKRLEREIKVWTGLGHPNIVHLLGTAVDPTGSPKLASPAMISPWMENGNLMRFLKRENPSLQKRLRLLRDVVAGLTYRQCTGSNMFTSVLIAAVHSKGIIHGDLTGTNIMIDDTYNARLSDFGLSAVKTASEGTSYWSSTVGGAIRWRAPELLPPFPLDDNNNMEDVPDITAACDIFSFGNVMLHVRLNQLTSNFSH